MSYTSEVIADGAVVLYECEEASGTNLDDATANNQDGTLQQQAVPNGPIQYHLSTPHTGFGIGLGDANNRFGRIKVPNAAWAPSNGDYTLEAGTKILSNLTTGFFGGSLLYAFDGTHVLTVTIEAKANAGGTFPRIVFNSGGRQYLADAYPDDHAWHHVILTFDASDNEWLVTIDGVDGTPIPSLDPLPTFGALTACYYGSPDGALDRYRGTIDVPALYTVELNATQRARHADLFLNGVPASQATETTTANAGQVIAPGQAEETTTALAGSIVATAAPTVGTVTPTYGPLAGGNDVIIAGDDLTGATDVDFGANPSPSFVVDSDEQITAEAPAGTGTVQVIVTTPAGSSA